MKEREEKSIYRSIHLATSFSEGNEKPFEEPFLSHYQSSTPTTAIFHQTLSYITEDLCDRKCTVYAFSLSLSNQSLGSRNTSALSMISSSSTLMEAMTARAHYSDKNRRGKKSGPRGRIYFQAISKFKLLNVKRFSSREPITQLKRIHERHPSKPRVQSNQTLLQVFFQAASPVGVTRAKCWKVSELKSIHRTRIRGTARARGSDIRDFLSYSLRDSYANSLLV